MDGEALCDMVRLWASTYRSGGAVPSTSVLFDRQQLGIIPHSDEITCKLQTHTETAHKFNEPAARPAPVRPIPAAAASTATASATAAAAAATPAAAASAADATPAAAAESPNTARCFCFSAAELAALKAAASEGSSESSLRGWPLSRPSQRTFTAVCTEHATRSWCSTSSLAGAERRLQRELGRHMQTLLRL